VRKSRTTHRGFIYAVLQASATLRKNEEKLKIPFQTTRSTKLSYAPLVNSLAYQGGGNNQNEELHPRTAAVDWPKDSPQLLVKIRKGDCERWGRAI
jgi:hypothetical protein